ncbi:glucan biosynthesis protein G [Marinobacter zhanjiangensis]|uniref:Glucans biosynthesis protein G n=1 Tax=Marinobacter zhanjiangensis TaxID=578215 RepID=A0ABQ3AWP3_9GAMM|nr:glucan biosynthesis protein G [Marinobacter zhanjiangensis]GGY70209.1 glucans biosynthesis protein G [Marinobacter zhanjiangensis]
MLRPLAGLFCLCLVATDATAAEGFGFDDVAGKAHQLSQKKWSAPPGVPDFLADIEYSRFQEIRFREERNLWRGTDSRFQVMLTPAGHYFSHAVALNEIRAGEVKPIPFVRDNFTYPSEEFAKRVPADLGYAGFRLTYPLRGPDINNQFLSFAGASYFRGVGRNDGFGLSARGVAIDTGLPSGEEFPSFTEFWLEKPSAGAEQVVVHALLDGPSLTGAYRFTVRPGDALEIDVKARLFFRKSAELPGYAPLTSMFYYGENTLRPDGEWRPQTHDSDGLLVVAGDSGEWLWRPLINPASLRMSYLRADDPRGFGLIQRDRDFRDFHDLEARYERRPSAWVRPEGNWGQGNVVLVEIPTRSEVNDNIVAFWSPEEAPASGEPVDLSYTLTFGPPGISGHPSGMAMNTFLGDGNRIGGGDQKGAYRILVDFAGGPLDDIDAGADVVSQVSGIDNTEVLEHFVEYSEPTGQWRLSMLVRPAPDRNLALRAFLSRGGEPLTETWTYELPPGVDIRSQ